MSDDCAIGSKGDTSPIGSPPLKKLKQSRLPFSPINTKSPKQNESEKKRKYSGSDDSTSTPKTPRSEIKETVSPDENKLSVKAEEFAVKPKSPEEEKKAIEAVKKRGRPVGSKNKLKDDSFSSPQGDASSPVAKKRGRPSGKSSSDLNKSFDLDKSIQDEEEKSASDKKGDTVELSGEATSVKADKEVCGSAGIGEIKKKEESQLSSSQDVSSKSMEQDELEKGDKKEEVNSTNVNSLDCREEGKSGEVVVKKRGRPKQSLSPQDEEKPKRKRGRPKGSKNIPRHGSQSSLNQSLCSNPSDDESSNSASNTPVASKEKENPMEKTRKLLGLFASPNMMVKKEVRKIKDMFIREGVRSTAASEKKVDIEIRAGEESKEKEIPSSAAEGNEEKSKDENLLEVKEKEQTISKHSKKGVEEEESSKEQTEKEKQDSKVIVKGKKEIGEEEMSKEQGEKENKEHDSKEVEKETKNEDNLAKDKVKESVKDVENKSGDGSNEEKTAEADESKDVGKTDEEEMKEEDKSNGLSRSLNESKELNESANDLDTSTCESEGNISKTPSLDKSSDADKSTASELKTPLSAGRKLGFTKPKKLTPKQKEKEAAKLQRLEERAKQQQKKQKELEEKNAEKEKKKKEREEQKLQKEEEKQKKKEEIEKLKEELRKKRQEENDAKKQKKEEMLIKKEEERLKKEEERLKKEEEKLKKEEEKQKKVEEQQKREEEKRMKNDKLKNKFASFFVAKKRELDDDEKESEGPFKEFRVKEDMQLAPITRRSLSESQVTDLDEFLSGRQKELSNTYLKALKSEGYIMGGSEKTWPCKREREEDDEDDDIMIVDEDDDDDDDIGDCSAMIQDPSANPLQGKKHRAKLLLFCENRRPAYWGTWSKKSSLISARRPFAKDEIFDYEYDSDDDWEEEEAGESLSDSEGEDKEEEKEKEDQYEVDNDFFVPHGYLSDDEGKSDQEEEEEEDTSKSKDTERSKTTEQLKLKQAEFEEEMKKKTKALKPRLIGCLWMADQNNNPAYDQLMKILGPHKAVTLCSQLPIRKQTVSEDNKEAEGDEDSAADFRTGNSKKFVKTFPEEAIPALIKLLHGNRHGKNKLCREFGDYWRKLTGGELEESSINVTPVKTPVSGSVHISKRKVESKIQELGKWKRCLDESISRHIMCWYVPRKVREEYGVTDLELTNNWIYVNNPVKGKKEDLDSDMETPKINKLRPITAFTKKIPSTPSSTNTSPSSTPSTTPLNYHHSKDEGSSPSINGPSTDAMSRTPASRASRSTAVTPSSASAADGSVGKTQTLSGNKNRKKVNLFPVKNQEVKGPPQKGSIVSFFKKNNKESQTNKSKPNVSAKESGSAKEEESVIVLD